MAKITQVANSRVHTQSQFYQTFKIQSFSYSFRETPSCKCRNTVLKPFPGEAGKICEVSVIYKDLKATLSHKGRNVVPVWMEGQTENKQKSFLVYYPYQTKQSFKHLIKLGEGDPEMLSGGVKLVK